MFWWLHGESCSQTNNTGIQLKELLLKSNEIYFSLLYYIRMEVSITALLLDSAGRDQKYTVTIY